MNMRRRQSEPLYKEVLEDMKAIVSDIEYLSSINMGTETEFWNNIVHIGLISKTKYHDGSSDVLAGVTVQEWEKVLDEAVPTVRKLKWPVQSYEVGENAQRLLKIPVIVSMLNNVYDLGNRRVPQTLIVRNPEKPYAYIRMRTELVTGNTITTEIPNDYATTLYGHRDPSLSNEYICFLRESDMGIPAGRTPEQLGIRPSITDATQIPALQTLLNIEGAE